MQSCMTIVEMLEASAGRFPARAAVIHNDRRVTYDEFRRGALALGGGLRRLGVGRGERVGLLLDKSPEALLAFLGVAAAGGVVFPMDTNQAVPVLRAVLASTRPAALIVAAPHLDLLSRLGVDLPPARIVVIGPRPNPGCTAWDDLVGGPAIAPAPDLRPDEVVYLNYTSGTTGAPKGALTTHANIYWNTRSACEALGLTSDDVHICMFPVFVHPHELFARPFLLGGTEVLVDGIAPRTIAHAISAHGVTTMMAVASIWASIHRFDRFACLNTTRMRLIESGGMHINADLYERIRADLRIPMVPVWGSTEAAGIALARPLDGPFKCGAIGRPCPHYDVRLLDEDGNEAGTGVDGELVVRGPGVCSGYLDNPEETARHMRDGAFWSGDLFRRDEDGYFFFSGRRSGMIKCGGLKVFPLEIEDALCRHPAVAECAVVRVVDRTHGEAPKAVIVLKDGARLSEAEVIRHCGAQLSRHKVPRVIQFVDALPRSPGGKVLYQKL